MRSAPSLLFLLRREGRTAVIFGSRSPRKHFFSTFPLFRLPYSRGSLFLSSSWQHRQSEPLCSRAISRHPSRPWFQPLAHGPSRRPPSPSLFSFFLAGSSSPFPRKALSRVEQRGKVPLTFSTERWRRGRFFSFSLFFRNGCGFVTWVTRNRLRFFFGFTCFRLHRFFFFFLLSHLELEE